MHEQEKACGRCGRRLRPSEDVRYEVVIEVKAASDLPEVTDEMLSRDHEQELRALMHEFEDLEEDEAMDQVYRRFEFDLCAPCQREYLRDPLPR